MTLRTPISGIVLAQLNAVARFCQQLSEPVLAGVQRLSADVVTADGWKVKRDQPNLA